MQFAKRVYHKFRIESKPQKSRHTKSENAGKRPDFGAKRDGLRPKLSGPRRLVRADKIRRVRRFGGGVCACNLYAVGVFAGHVQYNGARQTADTTRTEKTNQKQTTDRSASFPCRIAFLAACMNPNSGFGNQRNYDTKGAAFTSVCAKNSAKRFA